MSSLSAFAVTLILPFVVLEETALRDRLLTMFLTCVNAAVLSVLAVELASVLEVEVVLELEALLEAELELESVVVPA